MAQPNPSVVTRTINRYREAVEDHAFIGTIPRNESEDAEEYAQAIERELELAELALRRLINK